MNSLAIRLELDDARRLYQGGDILTGWYGVENVGVRDVRDVELSVLWRTDGKGDEDMAVHYFERWQARRIEPQALCAPRRFSTPLPGSPLSYDGAIVRISWCVRVRVLLRRAQDLVAELPFRLLSAAALERER